MTTVALATESHSKPTTVRRPETTRILAFGDHLQLVPALQSKYADQWLFRSSVEDLRENDDADIVICFAADIRQVRQSLPSLKAVCIVTDHGFHFSAHARDLEESLRSECRQNSVSCQFLRFGHFVEQFTGFTWLAPLLPSSARSTFVSVPQAVAHIEAFAKGSDTADRTLLGKRNSWRDELRRVETGIWLRPFQVLWFLVSFTGVGYVVAFFARRLGRASLLFDEIQPQSEAELLSLCHRDNEEHIAVCGYNNGVNHFGWQYPDRTVISTIRSGETLAIEGDVVRVDAGVTLKRVIESLAAEGRQLPVVPNYSYIAIGTVFFVPVHGSGSEVSTLGECVQWIRVLEMKTGNVVEAGRGDAFFREAMYNRWSGYVLLELSLRIEDAQDVFVEKDDVSHPLAAQLWETIQDTKPSNIELRKNRMSAEEVEISKYYPASDGDGKRLTVARDEIGQLWDRLEKNRVTAFLFHGLVRNLAFHVELFLNEREFEIFWQHHADLPISKLQLRLMRKDGMPHSPCRDEDRVSADLFMVRWHRRMFVKFLREHLPNVKLNPGKQSA